MVTTQLDAEQMLESAAVEYPDLFERPDGISKDKSFIKTLQSLRQTDNLTNWYYLVRTWVFLILVLAAGVAFDLYRANMGWSIWWNVPVGLVVITLVGAGQHQLTGLAHEASHYTLLANRRWNDLVSDWLCMYRCSARHTITDCSTWLITSLSMILTVIPMSLNLSRAVIGSSSRCRNGRSPAPWFGNCGFRT